MYLAEVSLFSPSIALLESKYYDITCEPWSFLFLLQVVNCWYTQLYVTSDVAVLCSFIRGGDLRQGSTFFSPQNKTYPEMLLYMEEGLSLLLGGFGGWGWGGGTLATAPCPMGSEVLSIFTHL